MRSRLAPLRAQERVVATALAALMAIACAALLILTALSRGYSRRVTTLNEGLRAIDNIRIDMSALGRQSALAYATKEPKYETSRSHIESDLLSRLNEAKVAIRDPPQNALLQKADRQVSDFIEVRRRLEAQGVPQNELMLVSLPLNQEALNTLYNVSRLGFVAVSGAEGKLARWELVETVLGVSIAMLVMGGFLGLVIAVRRRILAPLLALGEGIDQFASGDRSARVVPTGAPELQRTASSFNDMAGRLERQTRDLLTFLAGVAHDLRNPLGSMRMGVQLLAPSQLLVPEDKRQKTLELVERQLTRLEHMVGDFLDATRIESGNLRLEIRPSDLRAPARDAVDLYAASSSAHRLVLFAPERPVEVLCDVERVTQVLNNLVSNAIKYSPRGGEVVVSVEERGQQGIVSVRDWGIGIAPSEKHLVFEPFRRTGASRETAPGVGLGLSVARRIVEAHHGVIDFESSPGAGSTFRVHLPLVATASKD